MRRVGVLYPSVRASEMSHVTNRIPFSAMAESEAVLLFVHLHWAGLERSVYDAAYRLA